MNNKIGTGKAPAKSSGNQTAKANANPPAKANANPPAKANANPPAKANTNKPAKKKECDLKPSKRVKTHRIEKGVKRCLIVENMQNCFFTGGSMGFKKRGDENAFIKKVNQLISLHEVDERYKKASKSGREKKTMLGGVDEGIETNSRRKNYFDIIIFTQDGNPT